VLKAFNTVAMSEPLSHGREGRMDVAASATGWGGQDNELQGMWTHSAGAVITDTAGISQGL
jgi:hypothetical protein